MLNHRVLCVRLDNAGDVLLAGPAIRAVATSGAAVTVLAGPKGTAAARLLPGVDDVIEWACPWIDADPPRISEDDIGGLLNLLRARRFHTTLIFTSFHQSPLPTALVLRLAGVRWIGAISVDYPGTLLDLRHRVEEDQPEAQRALSLARAAGYELPAGDDGRLAIQTPVPNVRELTGEQPYVVVHPGTSVPARAWPAERFVGAVRLLADAGHRVVVTGGPGEEALTRAVSGDTAVDLGGRTTLAELASVLANADAVVVANTGPAHLAAAVGTPVVSLFAPTVPAVRWAPYGVEHVILGDQHAPCRNSRATTCPAPGHPCLSSVTPSEVVQAVTAVIPNAERIPS